MMPRKTSQRNEQCIWPHIRQACTPFTERSAMPIDKQGVITNSMYGQADAGAVPPDVIANWKRLGLRSDLTLAQALADSAQRFPEAHLIVHSEARPASTTLREMHGRGLALAGALAAYGVRPC